MLLFTSLFSRAGGFAGLPGVEEVSFTLTVPSGTVTSDLTDFVVYVDLTDMPSEFWTNVKSDGGDVRVYESDGQTLVPHDMVAIDRANQRGDLYFKASLLAASDNLFKVTCGNPALSKLATSDINGRNAVWSDYEVAINFHEPTVDRTGNGATVAVTNGSTDPLGGIAISGDTDCHQGVAWDGTYYYTINDNRIRKWNSSWVAQADNTDPIGASAIVGVDHCGDPEVSGGLLYIPLELYPNSPYDNQHIVVFDTDALSFVTSFDISAQAHEVSSYAINPVNGLLYASSYEDGSKLWAYDPADGSYESGSDITLSTTIANIQGITFFDGFLWVSSDAGGATHRIYKCQTDGTVLEVVYRKPTTAGNIEGLSHKDDTLLVLTDIGTPEVVHELHRLAALWPGYLGLMGDTYAVASGISQLTSWTMGCNAVIYGKWQNGAILSYGRATGDGNSVRATLARRASPDEFGLWNTTDSWITSSADNPAEQQLYRLVATHHGTTIRRLFVDGVQVGTDSGVAQKPGSPGDALWIGVEDADLAEEFTGAIQHVYLRSGILSDDWLAAEDDSWRTPETFYSVVVDAP
jgi:hypothetical protein